MANRAQHQTSAGGSRRSRHLLLLAVWSLIAAAVPLLGASAAGAATQDFSGTANAGVPSQRWLSFDVSVPASGTLTADLSWATASADLTLFIRNPAGTIVAFDGSSARPKSLSHPVTAGAWRVHVKARSGASDFSLAVTVPDGGGGGGGGGGSLTFDGSGSAGGPSWLTHDFDVTSSGALSAALTWATASADLTLFLRNPAGNLVEFSGPGPQPRSVSHQVTPGRWRLHVKVRAGSSAYSIQVSLPGGGGGGTNTAVLGDLVWSDTDGDGIRDADEPGLAGVTLTLLDSGGATVATTTSGSGGGYSFTSLAAGTYRVRVSGLPTGASLSPADQGGDDTRDSDVAGSGTSNPVTLAEGAQDTSVDVGVVPAAGGSGDITFTGSGSAAGASWLSHDLPITSSGQLRLVLDWSTSSADLTLFLRNPAGTIVAFNGSTSRPKELTYSVTPGAWRVHVKVRGGSSAYSVEAYLPGGAAPTGTVTGTVWSDADRDGLRDNGEDGLAGVSVTLLDSGGSTVATASTTSVGAYSFTGVLAGDYRVRVSGLPSGAVLSPRDVGGDDSIDSDIDPTDGRSAQFSVTSGSTSRLDAGVMPAPSGGQTRTLNFSGDAPNAAGSTWLTHEVNALVAGELRATLSWTETANLRLYLRNPVTNALVAVENSTDNPKTLVYPMDVPGVWKVHVQVRSGSSPYELEVVIPAQASGSASVGGVVFSDSDGDGTRDAGEPGAADVIVELLDDAGASLSGAATAADGSYRFDGLPAGSYQVRFTPPYRQQLSPTGSTSTPNPSTGVTAVTLASGQVRSDVSAGIRSGGAAAPVVAPSPSFTFGSKGSAEVWPSGLDADPATNRVFVADTGNDEAAAYDANGNELWRTGPATPGIGGRFDNPRDAAYLNGRVYVADTGSRRVVILDAANGRILDEWRTYDGTNRIGIQLGISAGVDANGNPIILITEDSTNVVRIMRPDGSFVANLGGTFGSGAGQLAFPRDAATGPDGTIYVADYANDRISVWRPNRTHWFDFGTKGSGPGQFGRPYGVDVGDNGWLYVADSNNERVQAFSFSGTTPVYQRSWGQRGTSPGQYEHLRRVAVGGGSTPDVWIADLWGDNVERLSHGGAVRTTIGRIDPPPSGFNEAYGITRAGSSYWVADTTNQRMQRFSVAGGAFQSQFGDRGFGLNDPGFNWPQDVHYVPATDTMWVADTKNFRLTEFRPDGTFTGRQIGRFRGSGLGEFDWPRALDHVGADLIVADTFNDRIVRVDTAGGAFAWQVGGIERPHALDVHEGKVYVVDLRGNVTIYAAGDGSLLGSIPSPGILQSEGIAVEPDGTIWLSDTRRDRLVEMAPDGSVIQTYGSNGTTAGRFDYPGHLLISERNGQLELVVMDLYNYRAQVLDIG